jgi:hypothetical protein
MAGEVPPLHPAEPQLILGVVIASRAPYRGLPGGLSGFRPFIGCGQ